MPKTIVITGASDGIGAAAARGLVDLGHRVVVVGRSPEKTARVADELGSDRFTADFTRLDDVRDLARRLGQAYPRIDVLANNAGGLFPGRITTVDGFETTFQVNHLAPFLLTTSLLENLTASRASVLMTSARHGGPLRRLDLDDLAHERARRLHAIRAYAAAKTENVLFMRELHRQHHRHGISTAAFDPGVTSTGFGARSSNAAMRWASRYRIVRVAFASSAARAADQLVWLAHGRAGTDWISDTFYVGRRPDPLANPLALDFDLARGLWQRSEALLARTASDTAS